MTKIKEEFNGMNSKLLKQGEAMGRLFGDFSGIAGNIEQLAGKIDTIKAAADANDG